MASFLVAYKVHESDSRTEVGEWDAWIVQPDEQAPLVSSHEAISGPGDERDALARASLWFGKTFPQYGHLAVRVLEKEPKWERIRGDNGVWHKRARL